MKTQKKDGINKSKQLKFLFKCILLSICLILFIIIYYISYNFEISPVFINKRINYNKRNYKIISISYSNYQFKRQIKLNRKSAIEVGEIDEHYIYGPNDLDKVFREKNKNILSRKRGNGYWLWKPYIINKTIVEKLNVGDYLIYTDAAMIFMNSSHKYIDFLEKNNASMWMNKLTLKERTFTKRDAFILMGVDTKFYRDTNQYMAGIQIYKKSDFTVKFIKEWLFYCQDQRIITDDQNTLGKPNYEGFIENRHDQTVLSLLIKKYGEANAGSQNNTKLYYKQVKSIIMPNIICIYRRMQFKDYEDLKEKCKKLIDLQEHEFT